MTADQAIRLPTQPLRRARVWFRFRLRLAPRFVPGRLWMVALFGMAAAVVLFFVRGR